MVIASLTAVTKPYPGTRFEQPWPTQQLPPLVKTTALLVLHTETVLRRTLLNHLKSAFNDYFIIEGIDSVQDAALACHEFMQGGIQVEAIVVEFPLQQALQAALPTIALQLPYLVVDALNTTTLATLSNKMPQVKCVIHEPWQRTVVVEAVLNVVAVCPQLCH